MIQALVCWAVCVALLFFGISRLPRKDKTSLALGRLPAEPVRRSGRESAVAQTVRPFDIVVREIGEATVVIREVRGRNASALLLVWAGKTRQLGCDSTYQLGTTSASSGLTDDVIQTFTVRAGDRLRQITDEGIKRREEKRAARAASRQAENAAGGVSATIETAIKAAAAVIGECESMTPVQLQCEGDESDVIGRPPSLVPTTRTLQGHLRFAGLLQRPDDTYNQFAIQVEVSPGIIRTMYGAGLKQALRRANVVVGSKVLAEKVGRQTMPDGLRPKSLFQVVNLDVRVEAANEPSSDEFAPIQFVA